MLKPMFREMRRNSQQLPQEEVLKILEEGSFGVLALLGDQGYPYGVPVSFVYQDEKIYFHRPQDRCPQRQFESVVLCGFPGCGCSGKIYHHVSQCGGIWADSGDHG